MAKRKVPSEPSTPNPTTAKKPKTSQPSVFYYLKKEILGELGNSLQYKLLTALVFLKFNILAAQEIKYLC
jgi:hypothetical protein